MSPRILVGSKTNVKIYIMRYIIVIFITLLMLSSCEKEESVILDLNISPDEISRIELRADHKTLVPNGVCKMGFHTFVYAKKNVMSYGRQIFYRHH